MARKKSQKNVVVETVQQEKLKKFMVRPKTGKPFSVLAKNLKEVYSIINNQI